MGGNNSRISDNNSKISDYKKLLDDNSYNIVNNSIVNSILKQQNCIIKYCIKQDNIIHDKLYCSVRYNWCMMDLYKMYLTKNKTKCMEQLENLKRISITNINNINDYIENGNNYYIYVGETKYEGEMAYLEVCNIYKININNEEECIQQMEKSGYFID